MKIIICGGTLEASFIIEMFQEINKKNHQLIIINEDNDFAKELSKHYKIPVVVGSYSKIHTLEDAEIEDADLFIALGKKDPENYVGCLLAKKEFNCKRVVAVVQNPKNVDIFKRLGIDSAISASYLISESIKNASNFDDVVKTLSMDNEHVKIFEINVKKEYSICNKELKDIQFPEYGTISAILRKSQTIIPKGKTLIKDKDRLIIVVETNKEKEMIEFIQNKK